MKQWKIARRALPFEVEGHPRQLAWAAILLLPIAMQVFSPEPARAAGRSLWVLRASAGAASSADDAVRVFETQDGPITLGKATHGVGDGSGGGLGLEYLVTERIGVELGISWYDFDTVLTIFSSGPGSGVLRDEESVTVESYLVGVVYHLRPDSRVDFSLGIFAAMIKPEDIVFNSESGRNDKMAFDDDVGFGALLRVDAALSASRRWLLTAELRALDAIFESEHAGQDLALDPLTVAVGVGYRW